MTTKSITLDVWQSNDVRVKVNQGEIDSRFLQIKITDKSKAFDLADKTVIFYATKPDGKLIFNYCEIIDAPKGVVNLAMTSQMSIVPGIMRDCEINIIDAGVTKLKVKGLSIEIIRCTDFDAAVESTSEFTALDEALADVQAVMDDYSEENIMKKIMSMDGEGSGLDADLLDGKHGKEYATAEQGKKADTAVQGITGNGVEIPMSADKIVDITPQDIGAVPITRRINNKPLSSDITLTPQNIGAAAENHGNHIPAPQPASANVFLRNDNSWRPITPQDIGAATNEQGQKADDAIQGLRVNGVNLPPNTNQILDVETADLGAVPVTRKINNQTLDKDINITVTDLGAATKKQGEKADSALQGIKVNGETIPASSDGVVEITISDTSNAVLGIKGNGSMIPKDKNNVVNITPHIIGAVPVTRTVNGKSLADDITITPGDLGGATAAQGEKADSAIQGIRGNGSIISPDGNKIVSVTPAAIGAATSEQGSKADSAIQGVKIDGTLDTFFGCSSLTQISIPSSVTSIGKRAFEYCSKLSQISIPSSVTSIGYWAFGDCYSLKDINISSSLKSIEDCTFNGCISLTQVYIPASVTSVKRGAFENCRSLTQISIPSSVTSIGDDAFRYCSSLTQISIPPGVTSIGGSAFEGCSSLTKISLPPGVTSIGGSAFEGCSSLTKISLPPSVTKIKNNTFKDCRSLTQISIPSSVTSIGWAAFKGCSSLTQVSIPPSVTSIGEAAFRGCDDLELVEFYGFNDLKLADFFDQKMLEKSADKKDIFSTYPKVIVPINFIGKTFCGLPVTKSLRTDENDDLSPLVNNVFDYGDNGDIVRDFSKDWLVPVGNQIRELINYMESHDINSLTEAQVQRLLNNLNHVLGQVKEDENGNLYLKGKWRKKDNSISRDNILKLWKFKADLEGKIV